MKHEVSRLEGFSDAVFGFALTLLVVSLEVPTNYEDLLLQMEGFWGFALMFAMVCWIWYEHNWFFRRTGLDDPWTAFLNSVLLFVVLFYVYPMKFLTAALMLEFFHLGDPAGPQLVNNDGGVTLMVLYSAGVVLIFGTFVLLYRHALSRRQHLALARAEELQLVSARRAHLISMLIGATSAVIALIGVLANIDWFGMIAGLVYFAMGPLHGWNGYRLGRALSDLEATPQGPGR